VKISFTKSKVGENLLSRTVIIDIVIPIVEKIIWQQKLRTSYRRPIVRDPYFEEFIEEELRRRFGVIGANGCQHLKEKLEEAKKNDPYAFELLVQQLLEKYVKLATKIRTAKKLKKFEGPPDRFSELRRRYKPYSRY
jgi:hypothetical protein